jgi:Protein of unknown function (DUF4019)
LLISKLRFEAAPDKPGAMPRRIFALLCTLSILGAGCATHSANREAKRAEEAAARAAALHWLDMLDAGDYAEAFEWEAQDFRMSRTQQQFVRYMQARRAPFGRKISRAFIGAANIHQLVGVPEGNYESILFKTAFRHKSSTAERVILAKQSVGWRVIDYRIY